MGAGNTLYTREQWDEVFAKAIEAVPQYLPVYRTRLRFLQPKWAGRSWQTTFDFANHYAQDKGGAFYALITEAHRFKAQTIARQRSRLPKPIGDRTHDNQAYDRYYREYFMSDSHWNNYQHAFNTIVENSPEYIWEIYYFAHLAVQTKRKALAYQYLNKLVAMDIASLQPEQIKRVAGLLKKSNEHEFSIIFYDRYIQFASVEDDPVGVYEAADYVGWYLATKGSWKKSYKYYHLVYQLQPDSVRAVANYCNALFNIHRYDEAIESCYQAIEMDKDHPWSYYILSKTYERKGDQQKAKHYLAKYKAF